jgi:hypothetical protein
MSDDSRLVIQPLDTRHDRTGFRCGVAALDTYLETGSPGCEAPYQPGVRGSVGNAAEHHSGLLHPLFAGD